MNYRSLKDLNDELESVIRSQAKYHHTMSQMREYYRNSAFYPARTGQKSNRQTGDNLLRVYADKNIQFTTGFPTIKVPTAGTSAEDRLAASLREKIILAVHRKNGTPFLQRKWGFDGTMFSAAVAETTFDLRDRCVRINRYDPRYCFWQVSNKNDNRVIAFWAVFPMTADQAQKQYGVKPDSQPFSTSLLNDPYLNSLDGKEWYLAAIRWDDKVRTSWVGNRLIEEPHEHMNGDIPIDIVFPFDDGSSDGEGAFYLEPMLPLQAEINLTIQRRSRITGRMSNPLVWGRGIISKQLDDIKGGLSNGGFVGLKQGGELGILQLNDVKLLNEHEQALREDMLRLSGFSAASMGELAGANTSGDALGMYFTPTQRHIENQYIAWRAFYESINAKILRLYDRFGKTGETFELSGYAPAGTLSAGHDGALSYDRGGYFVSFTKEAIAGNYTSIVEMKAITPKNEIEEKRLVMDAVTNKFLSRQTGYEMFGLESPQDEFDLLTNEQQEPALNPDGLEKLLTISQAQSDPQLPTATPEAGVTDVRQP